MQAHPCHDQPEICLRLTLDVGEDGPVMWGQGGSGNNRIQTMLAHYKTSWLLAVIFLYRHAIMVLLNATPPLP